MVAVDYDDGGAKAAARTVAPEARPAAEADPEPAGRAGARL